MARKDYLVEGRHFSTESEYSKALHDKRIIDRLRAQYNAGDRRIQEKIYKDLKQVNIIFIRIWARIFAVK